jgi:hypothetical protein
MSSLLKEAIVDAKALKDAALKNAEASIINKYSFEVKETIDRLLEQDELDLDMGGELGGADEPMGIPDDPAAVDAGAPAADPVELVGEEVPLAATDGFSNLDGKGLADLPDEGQKVEFNVNLDALQEAVASLSAELEESQEFEFDADELIEVLTNEATEAGSFAGSEAMAGDEDEEDEGEESGAALAGSAAAEEADSDAMKKASLEEEMDLEALTDAIAERLTVDMGASLSGWAGRSSESMKWEIEKEMAHRRSTDVEEEMKTLKKAYEELVFENKKLSEQNKQYKQATNELRESLQDVNLSNARLLYTNRVLRNTSLNERQKETIVEAISRAGSVTEARTIFDTLQSTAAASPKKKSPQSLSEAITRRSSSNVIRASRKESTSADPFQDRMKKLAGIK